MLHVLYIIINFSFPERESKIGECHAASNEELKRLTKVACSVYYN